jgi:hypothetical protein
MTSGSYYKTHMRGQAHKKHANQPEKELLTDRDAYVSFLEEQVSQVSAACATSEGVDQRLVDLQTRLQDVREGQERIHTRSQVELSDLRGALEDTQQHIQENTASLAGHFSQELDGLRVELSDKRALDDLELGHLRSLLEGQERKHQKAREKVDISLSFPYINACILSYCSGDANDRRSSEHHEMSSAPCRRVLRLFRTQMQIDMQNLQRRRSSNMLRSPMQWRKCEKVCGRCGRRSE